MRSTLRLIVATVAYAAVHSALASHAAKRLAARLVGPQRAQAFYRPFFIGQALVTTAALALYGQRQPTRTLYRVEGPAVWLLRAGQAGALALVAAGARAAGFARLTGAETIQAWRRGEVLPAPPAAQGPERAADGNLTVRGPYRWSRHPLNFLGVPVFWLTPHLTTRRLAFNLAATAYLYLGSLHEASRLRQAYGENYAAYERSGVPFFFPSPRALLGPLRSLLTRAKALPAMAALPAAAQPAYGSGEPHGPALEVDGIPVYVEGQGEETLLMLHGWPDTCRLWDAQVAALSVDFRCVRFTLPGYDLARGPRPMSLAQTLDLIGRVADAVSPARPLALLLHDWGCVFGYDYALAHPSRVRCLIGVDIGDAGSRAHARSLTVADKLMVAAYQLWLAAAWRIRGRLGDAMSQQLARIAGAPAPSHAIGHAMNYPYYLAWTGRYADIQRRMRQQFFEPPCPMLYVYGRRKPLMFHSPSWAARLAARPEHRLLGLDTGHWPMLEQPTEFNQAAREWLTRDNRSAP